MAFAAVGVMVDCSEDSLTEGISRFDRSVVTAGGFLGADEIEPGALEGTADTTADGAGL